MFPKEFANPDQLVRLLVSGQAKSQQLLLSILKSAYLNIPREQRTEVGFDLLERKLSGTLFPRLNKLEVPTLKIINKLLFSNKKELKILGIFLLAEYGRYRSGEVCGAFRKLSKTSDKQLRTAVILAFRKVLSKQESRCFTFLKLLALERDPNSRVFICAVLTPAMETRWLHHKTKQIFSVLKIMFNDNSALVKQALVQILNELTKKHPTDVLSFLESRLRLKNINAYWVAYRAGYGLIKNKKYRKTMLNLLKIDEYSLAGRTYK